MTFESPAANLDANPARQREPGRAGTRTLDIADYCLPLPGGRWVVWRPVVLRGAGFPASLVAALSGEQAPRAADAWLAAEDELARCRSAALEAYSVLASDAESQTELRRLRRKIKRGGIPADAEGDRAEALRAAAAAREAAHTELVRAFAADEALAEERLIEMAADDRFLEAVVWQDWLSAVITARRVRERTGKPSRRRKAEEFLAMHAQRYAVKNDSIGFFGPFGWASIVDDPIAMDVRPGPRVAVRGEVLFEGWCIDGLVECLARLPGIRPWTSPRLRTGAWRTAAGVRLPGGDLVPLAPQEERVLDLCDGRRTAVEIAQALAGAAGERTRVFELLDGLVARDVVTWRLEVPSQMRPERDLEARLARIGDPVLRAIAMAPLQELTAARARVAEAAGRAHEVARRLEELDNTFTRITGAPPSRNPGETYAARRLVYEDCRRNCDVRIGRELLDRLGPPLTIALDAAQWAAGELAAAVRRQIRLHYAWMREQAGEPVDGHRFMTSLRGLGRAALHPLAHPVTVRYQEKWQALLEPDGAGRHLRYDARTIAPRAREIFGSPGPVWNRAAYLSPDIMIAADGIEALRRGELHAVLGELHANLTLVSSAALSQNPDAERLLAAFARDTAHEPNVVPQLPKQSWLARLNRMNPPTFLRYEFADEIPSLPACRSMPSARFVAVDDGRTIRLRARDGGLEIEALEVFGYGLVLQLNDIIAERFAPAPHVPRLTIGDLTISRESWYAARADMPFLGAPEGPGQFSAVRRWARQRGMPRRVFYKSPLERKPCFLDFDSPLFVRIFIKLVRRLPADAHVRLTEMMPDLDRIWLHDLAGERYTCEFRMGLRLAR